MGQLTGATLQSEAEDLIPLIRDRVMTEWPGSTRTSQLEPMLEAVDARLSALEAGERELREYHAENIQPLVALLRARTRPWTRNRRGTADLQRVAAALVREGNREGIDPRLLAAVVLVENPWLDPFAMSPVGAVGLMQVMPFHAGSWSCEGDDLTHVETNVCHGTRILAEALRRTRGDLHAALLRYNGCRFGTNTPDCHRYPSRVYRFAGADEWSVAQAGTGRPTDELNEQ